MTNEQKTEEITEEVVAEVSEVASESEQENTDEVVETEAVDGDAENEKDEEEDFFGKGDWYIIQCYTGYEYKVKMRIDGLIEEGGFKETIFRVLVPEEETVEIRNNKRVEKVIRLYPGYVFIQMMPDE